ncbi:unnamed protein product, partial [Rotaria magnacalcarata]
MNRNIRNQQVPVTQVTQQQQQQQQPISMTPGSDSIMTSNSVNVIQSPHSHPGMIQQQQTPVGAPGQSPLAR